VKRFFYATPIRILALAGVATLAALVSNALAPPARRLAWRGSPVALPLPPASVKPEVPPAPSTPPTSVQPSSPASSIPSESLRVKPPPPVPTKTETPAPAQPIRDISSQEAWKAFQSNTPFLDARRSAEYLEGHIAGAWCVPVWEADVEDRLLSFKAARRPGPEDAIVIYCSGGDCRDSHLLAQKLLNEGYYHLLIYHDGFPDWVAQKRPVEKGQP
jgi:rhodanese-related sulfurtransferase